MAREALTIQKEVGQIGTISELTGIFESIASMRISKIKDKVTRSQQFFDELWQIYTQLRVDPSERMIIRHKKQDKSNVYLVLMSEGGLLGDIDQCIVHMVLENFDP